MSASVPAGDAREHAGAPVSELAATRTMLDSLAHARGVPALQALLTRAQSDWAQAHAALDTAAHATHSLSAFHAALFHLRAVLEPLRDALYDCEEDADALLWARVTPEAAVQPVLALLRTYRRAVNDLLFALPGHPPRTAPRRPSGSGSPSGRELSSGNGASGQGNFGQGTSASDAPNPAPR